MKQIKNVKYPTLTDIHKRIKVIQWVWTGLWLTLAFGIVVLFSTK